MRHHLGFVAAAVAACTLSFVAPAHAGTNKAWAAAKANLPADTSVAVAVDVSAIANSATFQKLFPVLLGKNDDVKAGLELVKTACKVDPLSSIKSLAVGLDATQSDGVLFVTSPDFTPAKLTSCLKEVAKAKGAGAKVDAITVKTDGGITEMVSDDGKHLFFGWVGADTLVIAPKHIEDKAALKAWMAGGYAKGANAKIMAKVNTNAAVFVASSVAKSIDDSHSMKSGYGWLTLASGKLAIEFHGDLGDAAVTKKTADDASAQISQLQKNPPLPALGDMLKGVTIVAVGSEIVAKASVVEKDFADLMVLILAST
jgi:hypothetical protein